jgi:hypothetical protein
MRCERWHASARTLQPRRAANGGQARVPGRGPIDVSMVTICPVLGSKIVMALPLRFVGGTQVIGLVASVVAPLGPVCARPHATQSEKGQGPISSEALRGGGPVFR